MKKSLKEMRKAYGRLPYGSMDGRIDLYFKGVCFGSIYREDRRFEEVVNVEEGYPYVVWVTPDLAIEFDSWKEEWV